MKKLIILITLFISFTSYSQTFVNAPDSNNPLDYNTRMILKENNRLYSIRFDSIINNILTEVEPWDHVATQNILLGEYWIDANDLSDSTFPLRGIMTPGGLIFQNNIAGSSWEQSLIKFTTNSLGNTQMQLLAREESDTFNGFYFRTSSTDVLRIFDDEVELPNTDIADVYGSAKRVVTYESLQDYVSNNTSTLSQEQVEDFVGGMVASSLQTGISVTYDDINGELGFVVDNSNNVTIDGAQTITGDKTLNGTTNIRGSLSIGEGSFTTDVITAGLTAPRAHVLQDKNGTLAHLDDIPSNSSELSYNNTNSTLSSENVKAALDELDTKISSNTLNYTIITDSIYTLQEADILAYKPHIIETYRADGTTQADTVTITYPRDIAPPENELLAVTFTNISGSAIKILPDSNIVIDKRTKTQRQYVLPKDYLGSVSLFSIAQDTIWANGEDWVITDYTSPVSVIPVLESFSHTEIATDATSVVATAPTGIQDDDILLMIVSLDDDGVVNTVTSTGFTELDDYNLSGSHKQTILWKRASSESGNYTVNWTDSQDGVVSIVRISGATNSGSPIDVQGITNDVFADNITPNDITSTINNTLALSFCSVDRNYRVSGSSTVSGTGWTLISTPTSYGADGVGFMWVEKDVPTAGSVGQPTFTFDSSDQAIGLTINIKS